MKRSKWSEFLVVILFLTSASISFGISLGYFVGVGSDIGNILLGTVYLTFVLAIVIVLAIATPYGVKVRGFEGILHRVLKAPGYRNEFFIQGKPEATFKEVVRDNWPFNDQDVNSSWKLVTTSGEDVTDESLSSYEGIVEIVFTS